MVDFIINCYRENRISAKTGNQYQVLVIEFDNGYKLDSVNGKPLFLSNEQQYILNEIPIINE